MNKKNVFKRITATVMAAGMAVSLAVTGAGGRMGQVEAAGVPPKMDSASTINFKQVLGGAVDYGIVADSITQSSHMETTFATNAFTNVSGFNNDVDYIESTALFLMQELTPGSKIYWGKSTASAMYLEAPEDVYGADYDPDWDFDVHPQGGTNGNITFGGEYGNTPVIQAINPNASSNVNRLIKRINDPNTPEDGDQAWSYFISDRATNSDYVLNPNGNDCDYFRSEGGTDSPAVGDGKTGKLHIEIDKEEFKNKVVYINLTPEMLNYLKRNGQFVIEKDPSTITVFNIEEAAVIDSELKLSKPVVHSNGSDYVGTTAINGQKDVYGYDDNSDDVNSEGVQKVFNETVIWNIMTEKNVELDSMGGAMLIPKSQHVNLASGNTSGWIVSGGDVQVNCEFHFLYTGSSRDKEGQMHFAVNKAFTKNYDAIGHVVQDNSVDIKDGDYEFFWQEYEDDSYDDNKKYGESMTEPVDKDGAVIFPMLTFTCNGDGSHYDIEKGQQKEFYFMITENQDKLIPGISNSDGNIKIKLRVAVDSIGKFTYFVDYVSTAGENTAYASYDDIKMSGVQFDLGRFYNKTVDTASLKLTKKVDGIDDPAGYADSEYKVAVKTTVNGKTYYVTDLEGNMSTTKTYLTIKAGEANSITIEKLSMGEYTFEEDEEATKIAGYDFKGVTFTPSTRTLDTKDKEENVTVTNTYEDNGLITTGDLSVTKSVKGYSDTSKEYTFYVKQVKSGKYLASLTTGELVEAADKVPFTIKDGETLTFKNVIINVATERQGAFGPYYDNEPYYEYAIEEDVTAAQVSGYDLTSKVMQGATERTDGVVVFNPRWDGSKWVNKTVDATLENDYEAHKNSLKISKTVAGLENYTGTAPANYPVYVQKKDTSEYVQDANGTLGTGKQALNVPAGGTLEIKNLPLGDYTVTEDKDNDAIKVNGYIFSVTGEGDVTVPDGTTPATKTITNTYREVSNKFQIKAKKNFTDANGNPIALSDGDFKFKLEGHLYYPSQWDLVQEKYNSSNGEIVFDEVTVPEGVVNQTLQLTLTETSRKWNTEGAKAGDNNITYDEASYKINVVIGADGNITSIDHESDIEFTNVDNSSVVPEKGKIIITKTIKGDVTEDEAEGALEFTITGPNGYTKTVKLSEFDHVDETKVYTYTLDQLEEGNYQVVESTKDITGKVVSVTYSVDATEGTEGSDIAVADNTTKNVAFEDDYTNITGKIELTKTDVDDGSNITGATFELQDDNGTITGTSKQTSAGKITWDGLEYGKTYKVVETAPASGYDPLTNPVVATVTVKETESGASVSQDGKVISFAASATNKKTATPEKGKIVITKTIKGDVTEAEAEGALVFTITGPNNYSKTVKLSEFDHVADTKVYTYTLDQLEAGNYQIVESTKDITGKVVSVAYSVDGTTGTEGSDIAVADNTTKNVAFEDDYTNITGKIELTKTDVDDGSNITGATFELQDDNGTITGTSKQTSAGKITWDGLEYGKTYKVVETAPASGYDPLTNPVVATVTVKETESGASVSQDGKVISFAASATNKKTATPEKGKIVITKTIKGDVTEAEAEGALVFTITGPNNYSKTVKLSEFDHVADTKVYTYTLDQLEAGNYQIVESTKDIAGKTVTVAYSVDGQTGTEGSDIAVADGTTKNVAFEDDYTNITGSVAVTKKKAQGSDAFPVADQTFDFTITLTYPAGTTDAQKQKVSVTGPTGAQLSADYLTASAKLKVDETLTVSNLPDGTSYDIAEVNVPANYTKVTTTGLSGAIDVKAAATKDVAVNFENKYTKPTEYGKLVIKKTLAGITNLNLLDPITFTITSDAGGTSSVTLDKDFATNNWTQNGDVYTYEIDGLVVGTKYTVEETANGAGTTYNCTTEPSSAKVEDVEIVKTPDATAEFTNTYSEKKTSITLKKTVVNDDGITVPTSFGISVRIGDIGQYIQDVNGTIGNDEYFFQVTPGTDVVINNLSIGTEFTFREDETAAKQGIGNYATLDVNGTYRITTDADASKNVASYTNTYKKLAPQSLTVSKTITGGANTTDPFSFVVSTDVGGATKYLQADGKLGDDAYTFTVVSGTPTEITIDESAVGNTFTVTEDTASVPAITGYTFDANDSTVSGSAEVTATTGGSVELINDYDLLKKTVNFSKVDATNSKEIEGAELTLYGVDGAGKLTKITSWTSSATEVYKFELTEGNYAIEETVAPEGYEKKTSLVKFSLTFDGNGTPTLKVTEGPGEYDAANDRIVFENDPIKVTTGKLSVHVVEEKTGRDVPGAEVEVEYPDGTKKTFTTNDKGEIVDENGKTPIDVPAGEYKVTVTKVPEGYEVTTGETGTVTVPKDGEARHEAKIIPKTGGLTITVLEEGTNRVVPGATVEIEAPDGTTFPDGSKKITVITDENGKVTSYKDKNGNTIDLTTGLIPGDYKVTVVKVPEGYKVTTGQTKTVTVKKGEVAEHIALIATDDTPATPTPSGGPNTPDSKTTPNPQSSSTAVNTGDSMNVVPVIIIMIVALAGIVFVIVRKRRSR